MNLKQILVNTLTTILVLFSTPVYAYAQVDTSLPIKRAVTNPTINGSASASTRANPTAAAARITTLQQRAESEIQRRLTALTELITKINSLKHLSDSQKQSLTQKIQTEINNLQALLTKIQSNTDQATLKTDVKSIVTSHRVYVLFMPQIRLLAGADSLLEVSEKMSSFSGNLQSRITMTQNAGQDTSSLQLLLTDMNTKIVEAKTQANSVITIVTPLTPEGYPENKTTLMSAKTALQSGIQSLRTAGLDARKIIQGLVVMKPGAENASSNSAVPKINPRKLMTPSVVPTTTTQQTTQSANSL